MICPHMSYNVIEIDSKQRALIKEVECKGKECGAYQLCFKLVEEVIKLQERLGR